MPTLAETLTRYFYLWERRGRGWDHAGAPVGLEPPFAPFDPTTPRSSGAADDGVHRSYLHFLHSRLFPRKRPDPVRGLELPPPREIREMAVAVFAVSLPRSFELDGYEARQLLLMLSYCLHPVSFEVMGTADGIAIQVACAEVEAEHVGSQLRTYYPTCTVLRSEDALPRSGYAQVMEFGLAQEFMRPLASGEGGGPSLYLGMKGVLDTLEQGESACVQVLFQGTRYPWSASILRSVSDGHGHSFFEDAPDMPKLARAKTSSQLFGVALRAAVWASPRRSDALLRSVGHTLAKQSASASNTLLPLPQGGCDAADLKARVSRRYGMLLNADELATFVHLPDDAVLAGALSGAHRRTKALPRELAGHPHALGTNVHLGVERLATASSAQRLTHAHVIGATGTGKSTFILGSVVQDMRNGNGVAVLDPHGDLVEAVLSHIPEERMADVVVVDPSDPLYSVGFNVVQADTELERELLSSDLVSVFQRLSTSWGDQMNSVLANALLAFIENTRKGTLLDVRRFLLEVPFRERVLKTATDPSVVYYWRREFPIIRTNSIGSILTRLDSFLRPKAIRYMVGQRDGISMENVLNSQRILLVKLSHGLIGESNSYLLGSLILSKIYQVALSRQSIARDDRKCFFVYVDEFQHFVTPSLSHILSGGRKYGLGLVLAHQSLDQIGKADAELASSLVSNAGIRVCFRLGEGDAARLEKGFASFAGEDFLSLATGEAICRVGRSDADFNLRVVPATDTPASNPADVIRSSRMRYGVLRSELDPIINPTVDSVEEEKEGSEAASDSEQHKKSAKKEEAQEPKEKKEPTAEPPRQEQKEQSSGPERRTEDRTIEDPDLIRDIMRRKEESKHKYLQMLIKRNAESRGYKAIMEHPTKNGKGRIDVVLQKDKKVFAIEIGVTTMKTWEAHNIEKCLADGYTNIFALSEDEKGATLMTKALTECGIFPTHSDKVQVYDLTGFMAILDKEDAPKSTKTKTVKGYRIRVNYGDKQQEC